MLLLPEKVQAEMAYEAALQIRDAVNADGDRLRIAGFNRVGERYVQIFFEDEKEPEGRMIVLWSTDLDVGDMIKQIRESETLPVLNDKL